MMIQKPSPAAQESPADQLAVARPANRNITHWEKPAIAELSLCLEVTAYIYHWQ